MCYYKFKHKVVSYLEICNKLASEQILSITYREHIIESIRYIFPKSRYK